MVDAGSASGVEMLTRVLVGLVSVYETSAVCWNLLEVVGKSSRIWKRYMVTGIIQ